MTGVQEHRVVGSPEISTIRFVLCALTYGSLCVQRNSVEGQKMDDKNHNSGNILPGGFNYVPISDAILTPSVRIYLRASDWTD